MLLNMPNLNLVLRWTGKNSETSMRIYYFFSRITGLDPAGPLFEQTTSAVRIDKSDCSFVDIIHTNGGNEDAGFLGMNAAVGHSDFFPNGGHQQPKCNNNFVCSHGEAPWIWVDSVKNSSPCSFVPCSSEQNWNSGACTSCGVAGCKKMGWDSTKPRSNTKYYGNTRSSAPYC